MANQEPRRRSYQANLEYWNQANRERSRENRERLYQANLEYWKATFEHFKAFATICLASIGAFSALLAGLFENPPMYAKNTMFSLIGCSSPLLSWFGTHRWMFMAVLTFVVLLLAGFSWFSWFKNHRGIFMAVLIFVVLILAGVFSLRGTLIPCLSRGELSWFKNHRWTFMAVPFFAFTSAGFFSLVITHRCRTALRDLQDVANKTQFGEIQRDKRIPLWRAFVFFSYSLATICFFIISALSIKAELP
jgi:hypothetical protein